MTALPPLLRRLRALAPAALLAAALLAPAAASAAGGSLPFAKAKRKPVDPDAVTTIASDRLDFDYSSFIAYFLGHAVVTDPEFVLRAEKLFVTFDGTNDIVSIECRGNVDLKSDDLHATCGRATYTRENGQVRLTESPFVRKGEQTLRAREISIWLNDERAEATSDVVLESPSEAVSRRRRRPGEGARAGAPKGTTRATGDSLEVFYGEGSYALLRGNAVVRDPEAKLSSDSILVFFEGGSEVRQIVCTGSVRIEGDGAVATCGKAVYTKADALAVFTENPVATRDGRTLSGEKITLHTDTERVVVDRNARIVARPDSFAGKRSRPADAPPSTVESDFLDYRRKDHVATFSGAVVVTDPDADLRADRMTVRFTAEDEVESIECDGKVVSIHAPDPNEKTSSAAPGDLYADAGRAIYTRADSMVRLLGAWTDPTTGEPRETPLVRKGAGGAGKVTGDELKVDLVRRSVSTRNMSGSGILPVSPDK